MAAENFIWGAGGAKLTPEQIALAREVLARKAARGVDTSPVASWQQGAARVADALGDVFQERRLNQQDTENQTYNQEQIAPLLSALGGSSAQPTAAPSVGAAAPLTSSPVDVSENGSTFSPFIDTIKTGVTNPYGLAAIASTGRAESGWSPVNASRSWADPSQSGQAGTAGGVMSWRGPRLASLQSYAASKGENGNGSPQTQAEFFLKEDPNLIASLNGAKSVEEAQSKINKAWAFAGYDQPGGEAGRRLQYATSYLPKFQGGQASTSPAAQAIEAQAPTGYVDPVVSSQPLAYSGPAIPPQSSAQPTFDASRFGGAPSAQGPEIYSQPSDFQTSAPPLPAPVNVSAPPPVAAIQPQPMQVAQASPPPNLIAQALRVMSDPRSNSGSKAVAQALIQRQQQQEQATQEQQTWIARQQYAQQQQNSDPLRAAQILQTQAQTQKLQREATDPNNGETYYGNPVPIQNGDGTMAYGQIGSKGSFKPIQLQDGQTFAPPTKTIDTGTEIVTVNQAGGVISRTPKQNFQAAYDTGSGSASAKTDAETKAEYNSITSKMPGLYSVVDRLKDLAGKATYTIGGQTVDWALNQAGAKPREGAVARAEYTAIVDNQILPLLRDTFGAQFTQEEGQRLSKTLGDPDKSPIEKQALLRAFIEQKERDITGLKNKMNKSNGTDPQPTKRLKLNPATGELE